jgi:hypothetical protein
MESDVLASPEPLEGSEAAPVPGTDDQKPTEVPASDADAQNPEVVTETPEQQEAKRESRRARSNARKAAELAAARTEARMLREQLERNQRPAPQESVEPKRENYQDYESYLEARAEWRADQKVQAALKAEREIRQRSEQQGRATEGQAKIAQEWNKREKAFQSATKDYDDVVMPYVEEDLGRLSDGARRLIVESDLGPQLLYKLASDADLQERVAGLSPVRQIAELGRIEASFSAPRKVTNAPAPIKPVSQGKSALNGYSDSMSDAEYREWRKAQGARWAR